METVVVYRHKKVNRASKVLIAVFCITIAAILISFTGDAEQLKGAKKFWNGAFTSLGTTISLQTVENYAPSLEFALYDATGHNPFSNWEMNLIHHNIGSKQNTVMQLVEDLSLRAEDENVQEASILDQTIMVDRALKENSESAEVGIIYGENYFEQETKKSIETGALAENKKKIEKLKSSLSLQYLLDNFYIVDSSTSIDKKTFNVSNLLKKDCSLQQDTDKPQILIYHTHSSESFVDSDGTKNDTVVGVGAVLAEYLKEDYGFNVIHDETCYDIINGRNERNLAYNKALAGVQKTLKKHPSIEVLIDLHRDQGEKRVTTIDGKKTAKIMFFNGLCRRANGEKRKGLNNPYLADNLAFSLKMKMKAMELYPDLTTKTYLKGFRFNLHLRPKSLLIELGTEYNTVQEEKNAMKPLAEVLNEVLNE